MVSYFLGLANFIGSASHYMMNGNYFPMIGGSNLSYPSHCFDGYLCDFTLLMVLFYQLQLGVELVMMEFGFENSKILVTELKVFTNFLIQLKPMELVTIQAAQGNHWNATGFDSAAISSSNFTNDTNYLDNPNDNSPVLSLQTCNGKQHCAFP